MWLKNSYLLHKNPQSKYILRRQDLEIIISYLDTEIIISYYYLYNVCRNKLYN